MAISSIFDFLISSSHTSHMKKNLFICWRLGIFWCTGIVSFLLLKEPFLFFRISHVRVGFLLIGCIKQPVGHGAMKTKKLLGH